MKTLVTHKVTNDHGLSFPHKLNTSNVQTRLINVRTTQKRFHNANGLGWLNEIGSWITEKLMQVYHQYGMGSRPVL